MIGDVLLIDKMIVWSGRRVPPLVVTMVSNRTGYRVGRETEFDVEIGYENKYNLVPNISVFDHNIIKQLK